MRYTLCWFRSWFISPVFLFFIFIVVYDVKFLRAKIHAFLVPNTHLCILNSVDVNWNAFSLNYSLICVSTIQLPNFGMKNWLYKPNKDFHVCRQTVASGATSSQCTILNSQKCVATMTIHGKYKRNSKKQVQPANQKRNKRWRAIKRATCIHLIIYEFMKPFQVTIQTV